MHLAIGRGSSYDRSLPIRWPFAASVFGQVLSLTFVAVLVLVLVAVRVRVLLAEARDGPAEPSLRPALETWHAHIRGNEDAHAHGYEYEYGYEDEDGNV